MTPPHERPPRPPVGSMVHYIDCGRGGVYGQRACRAAFVTEVTGDAVRMTRPLVPEGWVVGLCVLAPDGQTFKRGVVQDEWERRNVGTWHAIETGCEAHVEAMT